MESEIGVEKGDNFLRAVFLLTFETVAIFWDTERLAGTGVEEHDQIGDGGKGLRRKQRREYC